MAELVYALDLESNVAKREGSNPSFRTKKLCIYCKKYFYGR